MRIRNSNFAHGKAEKGTEKGDGFIFKTFGASSPTGRADVAAQGNWKRSLSAFQVPLPQVNSPPAKPGAYWVSASKAP